MPTLLEILSMGNKGKSSSKDSLDGLNTVTPTIPKTIIIADTDRAVRLKIRTLLSLKAKLKILEVDNGNDAIDTVARTQKVDLLILDTHLPYKNGLQVLNYVRRSRSKEEMAVVVVADGTEREMLKKLIELGINDFVLKPFEDEALVKKVLTVLNLPT